ncbi:MAG: type 4a pilus biogenesis protein PilO [Desulfobacterales bacterium]|nr:type 4a pilus biogenesis protein PilO [Desulfobacterales bacterium]MDJ0873627.1 type 4a pilus biogenesis protein PilO [Desulfobacterales bacterium]
MMETTATSKKLDQLFERIEALTKTQRILICSGVFALLIVLFGFLSFWPNWQRIGKLNNDYKKLSADLEKSKKNARQLAKLRKDFESKRRDFNQVMKSLPESEEISSLLTGISESGQESGLEFLLFQPGQEINKNFYAEIPVAIRVAGGYHNFVQFVDRVARLSRVVNIRDILISQSKTGELTTSCQAVTYKFIEAPAAKKPQKKTKKKK